MTRAAERALWIVGLLGVGVAIQRAAPSGSGTAAHVAAIPPAEGLPVRRLVGTEAGGTAIVAGDVFRLQRRPSAAPFRVDGSDPSATRAAPPLPAVTLNGVTGGPPWRAILQGVPGHSGPVVVRPGDSAGDFVVRSVEADSVVLVWRDTTVVLRVGVRK